MSSSQEAGIRRQEEQIVALRNRLEGFEKEKQTLVSEQNQLSINRTVLEREVEIARKKEDYLRQRKVAQDRKIQSAKDLFYKLNTDLQATRDRKSSAADKMKFLEDNFTKAANNIQSLEDLLSSQRRELDGLRSSRIKMERLGRKVDGQLNIALTILEKATEAVRDYDSEYSALENVAGEDMAIAKLNELGNSNALEGYFGPLRSLISYDPEYAQCVAAVGKDWLNAVVVRDLPALLRVTEIVRKLRIGRLTAIPLREVGKIRAQEKPQLPGLVAYVSHVVEADPELLAIVEFVFGDSVIVDSSKSAFAVARRGFRAVTLQGDIFEPDVLAYQTGYSKKYLQVATMLAQQKSYDGLRDVLAALQKLIERRRDSLSKMHFRGSDLITGEHEHDLEISKIETRLETTRQFVSRYAEEIKSLAARQKQSEQEIMRLENQIRISEKRLTALTIGSTKLEQMLSAFDRGKFDAKSEELNRVRSTLDSNMDLLFSKIRDTTTEMTRIRGELENNLKPALERLRSQKVESEAKFADRLRFLSETVEKLDRLQRDLATLQEKEKETLDRSAKYQPMLDALDSKLKDLKIEEEATRKAATQADREYFTVNNDFSRLLDSERSLVGDLALLGYPEPIETFEGVDVLVKELQAEFDSLKLSINYNADRNYQEI
ncbi:MAG TPA: hypothetical protein VED17_02135, partial [Nitrososphaerales archaeon]|nr:hypothetical protein [Nitrososphaerales archaeon]